MVPVSFALFNAIIVLVLCAAAGMAIGAVTGWLASLITRCGPKGVGKDAILGSVGSLASFIVYMLMPGADTIAKPPGGGRWLDTPLNTYQFPARVALALAVLGPFMHEMYRWTQRAPNRPEKPT